MLVPWMNTWFKNFIECRHGTGHAQHCHLAVTCPITVATDNTICNKMNPGYFPLAATALKLQHIPMFQHISARVWGRRWSPHTSELCQNRNSSSTKTLVRPRLRIYGKHIYKFHPYKSVWYISHAEHFISNRKRCGCMKETRVPPA